MDRNKRVTSDPFLHNLKRQFLMYSVALSFLCLFAYPVYRHLSVSGMRSEAKITLGFISSLQSAHHLEHNRFVNMPDYYGAPIDGKDNCSKPAGALELGLTLRSCGRSADQGGLRYAYKILSGDLENTFVAIADSGSDLSGEDFICLRGKDQLTQSKGEAVKVSKSCSSE